MFPIDPPSLQTLERHVPGTAIPLDDGDAALRVDSFEGEATYSASLEILPSCRVTIEAEASLGANQSVVFSAQGPQLAIRPADVEKFVELYLLQLRGLIAWDVVAQPKEPTNVLGKATELSGVGFGVMNLPLIQQPVVELLYKGPLPNNPIVFETEEWIIILRSRSDLLQISDHLQRFGTYAITHVGVLRRVDGSRFDYAQADEVLEDTFWLLSFARGAWGGPVALQLLDDAGTRVGRVWEAPKNDSAYKVASWLDHLRADALQSIFGALRNRLRDQVWSHALRLAIHWYVSTNKKDGGLEGSLVLCQNALELLAWQTLVRGEQILSKAGFKALPASDKIRLLLRHCLVPSELPSSLQALTRLSKREKWLDGTHALTAMRNMIVHPGERSSLISDEPHALIEAWAFGVRALELTILRLLGYQGSFRDRATGVIRPVPWSELKR